MKKLILKWCFNKTLSYLQNWRVMNAPGLSKEEWLKNNETCNYIYRFLEKDKIE